MSEKQCQCDLMIIGSGMAGMAAALFAADAGIKTCMAGMTGELSFASGLIDLMGVDPLNHGKMLENPFEGIRAISQEMSYHPLAKLSERDIDHAMERFLAFLNAKGLPYHSEKEKNHSVITGIGTTKPSYGIPESMMAGVVAFKEKTPSLVIDIKGMKGFSARQITETLKHDWPKLSFKTIVFPDSKGEVFPEHLAYALEDMKTLDAFAERIRPHLHESQSVGMPAILGVTQSVAVRARLEKLLNVSVFEIPALPPSLPGIRIKSIFERALPELGVTVLSQKKVQAFQRTDRGEFVFHVDESPDNAPLTIHSRAAVLASGRFFSQGLTSDYQSITETVFGLPVHQPETRQKWHSKDFFDKEGHGINRAGIETDAFFRPVDPAGTLVMDNLFAAGSVLANNDWKRMKNGAGVSIATAFGAVKSYLHLKGQSL